LYQALLDDASLSGFLERCDDDLAEAARKARCPDCGGALHVSDFPRKPRGAPRAVREAEEKRQPRRRSFCCAECRGRVTPPSVRFLGRKVYHAPVVVLVTAMRQEPTHWLASRLYALVGVSASTLRRWRAWWQESLPGSAFWRAARGRFSSPVEPSELPASLLERFAGEIKERLVALLRFLGPVTTASAPEAMPI
jgi:hypothetical protein